MNFNNSILLAGFILFHLSIYLFLSCNYNTFWIYSMETINFRRKINNVINIRYVKEINREWTSFQNFSAHLISKNRQLFNDAYK